MLSQESVSPTWPGRSTLPIPGDFTDHNGPWPTASYDVGDGPDFYRTRRTFLQYDLTGLIPDGASIASAWITFAAATDDLTKSNQNTIIGSDDNIDVLIVPASFPDFIGQRGVPHYSEPGGFPGSTDPDNFNFNGKVGAPGSVEEYAGGYGYTTGEGDDWEGWENYLLPFPDPGSTIWNDFTLTEVGRFHIRNVTEVWPLFYRMDLDPAFINLAGKTKFAMLVESDFTGVAPTGWNAFDVEQMRLHVSYSFATGACLSPRPHLPVEFRPAIGLSSTHDSFDGTAILNLCVSDPGVGGDCGSLIKCDVRHLPDLTAQWLAREGGSKVTPNQNFRTGFGIRPAWDLSIMVGTSRLGFLAPNAPARPEVNDGSFWHLMSILGESQSDVDLEPPALFAPYLYFTPNYQTFKEQWFPVGIDPANSTIGPPSFAANSERLSIQEMTIRLVARETYLRCLPAYFPSINVCEVPGITITALPPLVAALGGFTTAATLSAPLPTLTEQREEYGLMDGMLVNIGGTLYGWKLFTITALSSDRQTATLFSATNLSGAFLIPPSGAAEFRSVIENAQLFLPTYALRGFAGQTVPKRGPQLPLPGAFLLGAENPDED